MVVLGRLTQRLRPESEPELKYWNSKDETCQYKSQVYGPMVHIISGVIIIPPHSC